MRMLKIAPNEYADRKWVQDLTYRAQSCVNVFNVKVVLATFLSAMAAIAAIQSSGRERPLPSTQPSPHTVAHCARLRICVSNPRWTGEVVRLATIA